MEQINFKEVRTLGQIIQDAARFIRQHFVNILKLSLLWVIVPLLIGSVIIGWVYKGNFTAIINEDIEAYNPFQFFAKTAFGYLFIGVALTFLAVIILSYIKNYINGKSTITMEDIMPDIKQQSVKVFFSSLLLGIIIYIGLILCLIPGIYLGVVLAPLVVIMVMENAGFSHAWNRSFFLIKEEWWNAFGLYVVTTLINIAISSIVIIPMYAIMFTKVFTGLDQQPENPEVAMESMSAMAWIMPFAYLIYFVTILVSVTVITLKYFSLVESKEGLGEKEAIEDLGKSE